MMNLQNIVINFNSDTVTTMYENTHYTIDTVLSEIINIQTQFKDAYNIDFDFVVVQLTEDQHLDVPRILCKTSDDMSIITIDNIRTEYPDLLTGLQAIRALIESELQQILNN